jgi:hypothetical protein
MNCRAETISLLKTMDGAADRAIRVIREYGEIPPSEEHLGSARSLEQLQLLLNKIDDNGFLKKFRSDVNMEEGENAQRGYKAFHKAIRAFKPKRRRRKVDSNSAVDDAASADAANGVASGDVANGVASSAASADAAINVASSNAVKVVASDAAESDATSGEAASALVSDGVAA